MHDTFIEVDTRASPSPLAIPLYLENFLSGYILAGQHSAEFSAGPEQQTASRHSAIPLDTRG